MTTSGPGSSGAEDPRFYEALGRAIKVVRAQQGLSRGRLAELADISYPYLSEVENGKKRPSSKALLSIADALALPASKLLGIAEMIAEIELTPARADEPSQAALHRERSIREVEPAPTAPAATGPALFMGAPASEASLRRAARAVEGLPRPIFEATPPPPVPDREVPIDDLAAREALVRLIRAAEHLSIEDLERLADLAERLAR